MSDLDIADKPTRSLRPGIGSWALLIIRLLAGGLFVFAAFIKLNDPHAFAEAIVGFDVIPKEADHLILLAAFVVPWLEALTGVMLVVGLWTRASSAIIALMLLGFAGLIYSVIARDMTLECGCFGKIDFVCQGPLGWCSVIRNGVHALLAAIPLVAGSGLLGLDSLGWKRTSPAPNEDDGE
ncbi:MAG: MauE/DoxX family redox-associated membrane protein [Planctomycetota bacterium]